MVSGASRRQKSFPEPVICQGECGSYFKFPFRTSLSAHRLFSALTFRFPRFLLILVAIYLPFDRLLAPNPILLQGIGPMSPSRHAAGRRPLWFLFLIDTFELAWRVHNELGNIYQKERSLVTTD